MNSWLKLLLGPDADRIPDDANLEFGFAGAPQSWGWLVLVAVLALLGYVVFWLYRREMESCPRWVKRTSAALRFTALLLLALVFLSPYVTYLQKRTVEPHVVLLRDNTQSMNTADYYDDSTAASAVAAALGTKMENVRQDRPTRTAVVNQLLAKDDGAFLKGLAARGKLTVLDFAEKTEPASSSGIATPLTGEGRATDLTQALDDALANSPLAAVVLMSDGQHNAARPPSEAARRALERRVPLLVVGVGDPSRTRNLRVASVYVRPQVWPGEPFEVRGSIVADSVDGGSARVELLEQPLNAAGEATGEGTVIESTSITLPAGGGQVPVQFSRTLEKPGKFKYTVRVARLDDERNEADNAKESDVLTVLDRERIRVLLVAATPSWEYRLLQPLLQRDKTISLSCWLQALDDNRGQAGTEPIDRLPATEAQLFKYDVVLLLDPHPGEFTSQWVDLLRKFVDEHSGGVLYMAGPKYSAQFLTDARLGSGLRKILPVEFGDLNTIEVASLLSTNTRDWPLHVMTSNADHPLMKFYPSWQESLARWENLPGIYWSFPALKQKPTSKLLLEHTDPTLRRVEGGRPLLVAGRYGSGRVVYLGFNGTWRWRRAGTDAEFFDRFWVQTVRFLAEGRSLKGQRRGYLQAERERYEIGEKVSVLAELKDASFQPLVLPGVEGVLVAGSAAPQPLAFKAATESPGKYVVTFTARRAGVHTIKLPLPRVPGDEATGEGVPTGPLETSFTVELPSAETTNTWLNKPLLSDLAQSTSEVGGRYFEINQLSEVAAAVPERRETVPIPSKPITLWDRPWFGWFPPVPLLATLLLCVEWALRKGYKLL